jgi:enoyl-CoA hydratase/carnithine racemase
MNPLIVDEPVPGVVRVLLNRPDKRNAVDHAMRQALIEALDDIAASHRYRALLFGGAGGVFSAGGDVPTMIGLDAAQARERLQHGHRLARRFATLELPVVAAIEGIGAGACIGLACLADHVVVGRGAKLMFPFLKLGLIPDWGTLHTLPRRVGLAQARRLLMDAATVDGAEAVAIGLADQVVDDGELAAQALAAAVRYARLPLRAFARMKNLLRDSAASLETLLPDEEQAQVACLLDAEFAEGHAALMHKRAPDFAGLARKP